jgi:hypothetical protein
MNLFGNYSFGFIFVAIAIVHFIRRRPDNYWLWIIIMGGGVGALIYIVVEVPDLDCCGSRCRYFARKRIRQRVMVLIIRRRKLQEWRPYSKEIRQSRSAMTTPSRRGRTRLILSIGALCELER